jgi:predicted NAD/FAD-binding protein
MRVAVVGTGSAGLAAAHRLAEDHDVTILEADARPGGHTHTRDVHVDGGVFPVDSGFIVCNDRTYPNFLALMDELGVALRPTNMSFGVSAREYDFEYHAESVNGLFAQRRNAVDPRFLRMVLEYVRFNGVARRFLASGDETTSLRELLRRERFSPWFADRLIVPQASAVWSADPAQLWDFPAIFLIRFFENHGMLSLRDRPQWMTVVGGSRAYVDALLRPLRDRLVLDAPVVGLSRSADGATIRTADGATETYDQVVLACHSDQALALLEDPTDAEHAVLGAIPYQENAATLHTDTSIMPRRGAAWSSWNAHLLREPKDRATLTYDMNRLQGIDTPTRLLVTLNMDEAIAEDRVLERMVYHHPVFTTPGLTAQRRWAEISGPEGRTHYAGAYWRWGFHEDGVWSGLRVARSLGSTVPLHEPQPALA